MKNAIKARVIVEVLGAPKEHVQETLKGYIEKIKTQEKKISILHVDYAEPKEINKLFSAFAELEMGFESMDAITYFCFDYMPSSIEIYEPEEILYSCNEFTNFLNDLQARLHKIDRLVKNLAAENKIIKKNGLTLAKNVVLATLEAGPKTIQQISKVSGMPEEHIKKFVNVLLQDKKIKENNGVYSL